ncbi:MAG: SDR family NAD(P)-dependent oxidoreductase [Pirellulales bacterium]
MSDLAQRLASLSPAQRQLLETRLAKPAAAEPIAIIGMACRFPGARSLQEYWQVISEGIDATSDIPASRWDVEALYDPTGTETGKMSTRWGGFLADIDQFDPVFFGITPREAARMDPQQRLLLEVAWEAMENAGRPADQMAGSKTAVFVGIGGTDYSKVPAQFDDYFHHIDAHVGTGNALSIASNRVSYIFDLHGPSASVDTACSSSSLAIHLAVESLRRRESDAALAGGVNAIITPETTIAFSKARMLSPDGKCRPFDAGANGYVRGEGCGLVLLKRLADAERDGDQVLAVIRGTAVNSDGRTSGISAPNGQSQQACIHAALAQAGLTPGDVSYIEAHGTGTPLGDPIEMQALVEVFRRYGESDTPVHVTSVKANIGHTETVSGVAGLIKVALLMNHGQIVPQLHMREVNPHINLEGSRITIPTAALEWAASGRPRIAGISSFGFGGTNTHIVIEGPGAVVDSAERNGGVIAAPAVERPIHLLKLSAKTDFAIRRQAEQLAEYLLEHPEANLADVCYSANTGRADFNHRSSLTFATRDDAACRLSALAAGKADPHIKRGQLKGLTRPKVAFLFTGQGSQYPGMGRQLYETEPTFRAELDRCDDIFQELFNESLLEIIHPKPGGNESLVNETVYTQPALFAIEYALAQLWQSWGATPDIMLGHSVGEYVAATIAGVMSLDDGLALVAHRARLMQQVTQSGKMAVVFASESRVAAALAGREKSVAIATINGPENTVISGAAHEVDQLAREFEAAGLSVQPLTVSHAFHSPLMDEILDSFERLASEVEFHEPQLSYVSNLTGQAMRQAPTPRYWREHLRNAVRFSAGMDRVAEAQATILVEMGPTASLLGMGRRCLPEYSAAWIPSLRKGQDDWSVLAASVGEYFVAGGRLDWRAWDHGRPRQRLLLPNYPFERSRHWLEPTDSRRRSLTSATVGGHPLLGVRVPSVWVNAVYETVLEARRPAYLVDHQVQGSTVVPAAAFIEQALAAAEKKFGPGQHAIENLAIQQAMFLPEGTPRRVQTSIAPESNGEAAFESHSVPLGDVDQPPWTLHAAGTLKHQHRAGELNLPRIDLADCRRRTIDRKSRDEYYQILAERGLKYGPAFRVLDGIDRSHNDAFAKLALHESVARELAKYQLHPALGDACMQTLAATVPLQSDGKYSPFTYMPVAVRRVVVLEPIKDLEEPIYCYAVRRSEDGSPSPELVESDIYLVREDGRILVAIEGARVQRIGRGGDKDTTSGTDWLYRVAWREAALAESPKKSVIGTWLLFADEKHVAKSLAKQLPSVMVRPSKSYFFGNGSATIDPLNEEHYSRLLANACGDQSCAGIVHFWSLDIPDVANSDAWDKSRELGTSSALLLLKQLARRTFKRSPSLWFVTAGAQAVDDTAPMAVAQSPLVGLVRVATVEHPDLRPCLIDLDPSALTDAQLCDELLTETEIVEHQIAYRDGRRHVARLQRDEQTAEDLADSGSGVTVPASGAFQLRIPKPGSFDALRYLPVERKSPGKGQVEIEVRAAGLNFSDVLKALGLYPGIKDAIVPLGIEASGVVTAVGDGIDRFQLGDEVMGVLPYAFASHAVTADYALVKKPRSIDYEEACTIPITFLTAYYGLVRLADLQPGERVLIHAAAGGVGLAAIQIAQQIGAEIFATAGSDDKREFLRSLGVKHVYSSRSLDFAEQILADTGREGVDVVLNSLPGEAITKSLSILRAYGRFLEIGKIDIYQNRMLGLLPFQDNLSYFAIDLDRMLRQRPEYIRELFAEVMEHFESGAYQPLVFTQFAVDQTIAAFRYMSQRKNTGKVVVSLTPAACGLASEPAETKTLVRHDASYLITGGLGALGLQVARWLADQGAGGVALMGRREPTAEARAAIAEVEARGMRVATLAADVTDAASLQAALRSLPRDFPPLRGVIHAAGVLADGVLADMSLEQLDRAMRPKVQGAWNLHMATRELPLDFFVLFSSVAAILGSPGQGNYAAGNAMLDALAHSRRRAGLPATTINWGPWADSGMAAAQGRGEGIKTRGMDLLPAEQSLELLGKLLRTGVTQSIAMDVHWDALLRLLGNRRPSLLADIASNSGADGESTGRVDHAFRKQLLESDSATRESLLVEFVRGELARIMGVEADQLDTQQPLAAFGLDSLMALELKNNLEGRLAFTLPMAKLLEGPSIRSLAADTGEILAEDAGANGLGAGGAAEWQPLIELKPGTGAPLILFPALGGDVRCYALLVMSYTGDRPIVAFRPRGIDDNGQPHVAMVQLVTDYLAALKARQPQGPYYLAGWSAGGVAAFAMADRLRQAGDEVALVALIDTPLPSIYSGFNLDDDVRFLCDIINFANRFAGIEMRVSYDDMVKLEPAERFPSALAEAKRNGMFPEEVSEDYVRRLVMVGEGQIKAIQSYTPLPLDMPVHLFRPETLGTLEEMSGQTLADDLGWNSQIGQKLIRYDTPGDHFTMMTLGAEELARELEKLL